MRRISDSIRKDVKDLWMNNFTYKQISQKLQISQGCISEIINESREKNPDLDELRKLSCLIKKNGLNIIDTTKGAKLCDQLNQMGVNFPTLENYIITCQSIAEQNKMTSENFVQASIKLFLLEDKTCQTYESIVDECNKKLERNSILKKRNRALTQKNKDTQNEINKTDETYLSIKKDLEKVIETKTKIENRGINRFAEVLVFIERLESIGLEIEEIQQLDEIRTLLNKLSIEPEDLKKQIQNRIFQEQQYRTRLQQLTNQENLAQQYQQQNNFLKHKYQSLLTLDSILTSKSFLGPCRQCQTPILYPLLTQTAITFKNNNGQQVQIFCPHCGDWYLISPHYYGEILGWNLLP